MTLLSFQNHFIISVVKTTSFIMCFQPLSSISPARTQQSLITAPHTCATQLSSP